LGPYLMDVSFKNGENKCVDNKYFIRF